MIITVTETRPLPSMGIPFPPAISETPSLLQYGSSDTNLRQRINTPRTMLDHNRRSRSAPKKTSLRLLSAPDRSRGSLTLVRVPSSSSTTTVASAFQHPGDLSIRGDAVSGYTTAFNHQFSYKDHLEGMRNSSENNRSIFQFLTRKSISMEKGITSQTRHSMSSPSLSTPESPADAFTPSGILTESKHAPRQEHRVAFLSDNFQSDRVHEISSPSVPLKDGMHHERAVSQTAQRLRKKSSDNSMGLFEARAMPTLLDLSSVENLEVLDQNGIGVKFGGLWKSQRTCVIFIRHFWCQSSMDYTRSIVSQILPETLHRAGVRLVIISNGSSTMIKPFQSIFKIPFSVYTDPSLSVYHALGMTLRILDGGPESERGQSVKFGKVAGIAMSLKHAAKSHMPVHKNGGDPRQLGGEFVLGPGLSCSYASRMRNTLSHTPVLNLLAAAGVELVPQPAETVQPQKSGDEDRWMEERETELRRMRAKKGLRRGFTNERRGYGIDQFVYESVLHSRDGNNGGYNGSS